MPTVDVPEIRVKTAFNGEVMITYIDPKITVDQLRYEMMVICRFSPDQDFTMKWVDEEGDPCILSTQMELDEAIRLYELNKDSELTIHGKLKTSFTHSSTNLIKFSTSIGHYDTCHIGYYLNENNLNV